MTAKDPLPQSRHLATEIPGPLSTAAMQRRKEAVSGGLGTALPVIVSRAQDAIIEDIDMWCELFQSSVQVFQHLTIQCAQVIALRRYILAALYGYL